MSEAREEYQRTKGRRRLMRSDMTTNELLREAAYLRLFETPADVARADTEEEDSDG